MPELTSQNELESRYRLAAFMMLVSIAIAAGLTTVGFLWGESWARIGSSRLPFTLWIVIMIVGLGAFVYRRFMFAGDRLRDIGILRGTSGLLRSLQSTTIQLALGGTAIALLGFCILLASGNRYDMLRAGAVALIVLLYSFPQKSAWNRVVQAVEKRRSEQG
jgi:hypothetical protein